MEERSPQRPAGRQNKTVILSRGALATRATGALAGTASSAQPPPASLERPQAAGVGHSGAGGSIRELLRQRAIGLLDAQQCRGAGSGEAGSRYRQRKRRGADGVGQLCNDDDILLTQREVEGVDLPFEALHSLDDCLLATGRLVFLQTAQAFGRIGCFDEVLGHGVLLALRGTTRPTF